MAEQIIITIERLTACGGLYIGRRLAERLMIPCYDREILTGAAQLLHIDAEALTFRDESRGTVWERILGAFSSGTPETEYAPPPFPFVEDEDLFNAEASAIRSAASRGGGVFIGHGAATALLGHPRLLRVFCHAPREFRISRLCLLYPEYSEQDAAREVDANDLRQQKYLRKISGINWRDATAYDLTINTALTGIDTAVEVIHGAGVGLYSRNEGI